MSSFKHEIGVQYIHPRAANGGALTLFACNCCIKFIARPAALSWPVISALCTARWVGLYVSKLRHPTDLDRNLSRQGPTQKERDALLKMQEELLARVEGYREKCYPMPKDGCSCIERRRVHRYDTDEECRGKGFRSPFFLGVLLLSFGQAMATEHENGHFEVVDGPVPENSWKRFGCMDDPTKPTGPSKGPTTKERNAKAEVQEELMERVRGYRRRCYPMPVDGCRCDEILGSKRYATDEECRRKGPSTKERNAKAEVQEELMERVKGYRRKCYPMPVDGCRCDEILGSKRYATDEECRRKGPRTKERNEKAAMQAELMSRVEGYRDKCYPMPKDGCLCQERRGAKRYDTDVQCRK
ncbi:hypothetical protein TTRE_0000411301 [Trichuris trichiura]|uniref:Uncharacterized protein n=1 Tax=Trichuris trichiura TaxID=36087 RepID=A0A077Z7U0_TRITR|nr:hypothetical protein TTRE_0000411301 [Trichuris trichiura]